MHLIDTADALALAAAGIQHIRTCIELTRVNAHESQTTYEGVGSNLEREAAERIIIRSVTNLGLLGLGVRTLNCGNIQRRGEESHHIVEQLLYALVVERRTAEHRHNLHRHGSRADSLQQLFGGNRLGILEELLHQGIVRRSNLLDQLHAPLLGLGLHVLRNLANLEVVTNGLVVVVVDGIIINKVNQTLELVLNTDGENNREGGRTEVLLDLRAYGIEIGTRAVHLINVTDTGDVVLIGLTPYGLRLRLHTTYGAERSDSTVQYTQRTLYLDGKVNVSRGVNQVDLVLLTHVVPEGRRSGRRDGDTTLLLLNHPVHGSGTLVRLTNLVGLTRVEQNTLRRGRLTGIDVSHDTDITRVS